jgi:CubicO group peptidase (beta-lactamase class C family)
MRRLTSRALSGLAAAVIVSAAVAATYAVPAFCQAGRPGDKAAFPDTPVGKLARAMIDAINSGDRAAQMSFLKSSLAEATFREESEGYLRVVEKLYAQSGGLDVMEVLPGNNPSQISLVTRSRRGNYWVRIMTRLSEADPTRLDGIGVRRVPDPSAEQASKWPEGKLSEQEIIKAIEQRVERASAEDRFSGVVLISKGDRVMFNKAYGKAEQNFGAANNLDTKFNLGSMNKMFTSVAIAQLAQAGKLSYEDTIARLLPDYPNKEVAEKVKVHHLLTHTSGLGDYFRPQFFQNRERYVNPKDYFPIFASEPLRFEPGKGWSYSNAGFIVLGAIIEKLSGMGYFDYVREQIFKPNGMVNTDSYAMNEIVPNLAVGYTRFGDGDPLGIEPRQANHLTLPLKGGPAGGGYSTAPDLLRFARALRGNKLLKPEMTELITCGKVDARGGVRYGYAFFDEVINGKTVRGHSGGAPGINSDMKIFWDGSYTVIVMGNYDPPAAQMLSRQIAEFLAKQ